MTHGHEGADTSLNTSQPPPPNLLRKTQTKPPLFRCFWQTGVGFGPGRGRGDVGGGPGAVRWRMGAGEGPARGPQHVDSGDTAPVPQFGLWSAPSRVEAQGGRFPASGTKWPGQVRGARQLPGGRVGRDGAGWTWGGFDGGGGRPIRRHTSHRRSEGGLPPRPSPGTRGTPPFLASSRREATDFHSTCYGAAGWVPMGRRVGRGGTLRGT